MKKKYYVVLQRHNHNAFYNDVVETVHLFNFKEAVEHRWIDDDGNRIWIVSPEYEEHCHSFIYGFNDLDEAVSFAEILINNQIGMKVIDKTYE